MKTGEPGPHQVTLAGRISEKYILCEHTWHFTFPTKGDIFIWPRGPVWKRGLSAAMHYSLISTRIVPGSMLTGEPHQTLEDPLIPYCPGAEKVTVRV